ncbi:MAG: hypothetical protein UD750_00375 [Collinsella sp.]|nr:hypothetical protein [Collinsella sp.]
MNINHNDAICLERIVREAFSCDRGGMGGLIDADHFEQEPFDAALILLTPLWLKCRSKEIEEFLEKWGWVFQREELKDGNVEEYIQELQRLARIFM